MNSVELIEAQIEDRGKPFLTLSDEEIDALDRSDIEALQREYGTRVLMQLPPRERAFFEWLRREDPDVWTDLWDDDEELLVALSYLPDVQRGGRGFPICELESSPNYYFTARHITRDGMEEVPRILGLAEKGKELSTGEALLFEVMIAPIDIWRFCYIYGVSLAHAKETVRELYQKNILVHLPERADLIEYLDR